MKPNQTKKKLQLKKQAVFLLSKTELENIKGGNQQQERTTSNVHCTGIFCCEPQYTNFGCPSDIAICTITSILL